MHLLPLFNIKRVWVLAFLFLVQSFTFNSAAHASHASTLYEELNAEQLHTKLAKLDLNKERKEVMPPEMLTAIFDAYPGMLPKVARINHDWNQWAQPRLTAYTKLFEIAATESEQKERQAGKSLWRDWNRWDGEYKSSFLGLVFQKPYSHLASLNNTESNQLKHYLKIRKHISNSVNVINRESDELFIDNPDLLDTRPPINHGTSFNLSKLLRAWAELQMYKSAVLISKDLWSGAKLLESSIDTEDTLATWYAKLHKPTPGYVTERTWLMKFIISEAERHEEEFPSSRLELSKLLSQFIELDKLALAASHKDQEFYANYPSYNVMKAFQAVPVDLDHNTREDRILKLEQLKGSILTFAKKHVGPMEFYITLIRHQLARG